jgi:hypothetical protein
LAFVLLQYKASLLNICIIPFRKTDIPVIIASLFSAIGGFALLMISFLPSCQNRSISNERDQGTEGYNVLFIAVDDWNDPGSVLRSITV